MSSEARESEAAHQLAAFINRFKFIAYDTGVLQGTEEILGWSIGSTAAPFVGRTASNSLRSIQKLVNSQKLLRISNPNILNKTLPGYTDAVEGTIYRQGRGPLIDYPTHKPALQSINNQYFNRIGGASTGVGLKALAYYYYHRKTIRK